MAQDPTLQDGYQPRDYQDETDANDHAEDRFTEDATSDLHGVIGIPADKLEKDLDEEARELEHPRTMEEEDKREEIEDMDEHDD